jgi:maltoporin
VNVPGGKLGALFDFARAKGGTTQTGIVIPTDNAYAFGIGYQNLEWHGGFNQVSVQYGKGVASNFSTSIEFPTSFIANAKTFRVAEEMLLQPNDKFAIQPIFLYQRVQNGNPSDGWDQWLSFGARPQVFFTEHLSLAFESGFDHTISGTGQFDGWLRKFTIVPEIRAGRQFFSRPALRIFATYASWSNGFRGFVGGVPFEDRTNGWTYGVQAETWW